MTATKKSYWQHSYTSHTARASQKGEDLPETPPFMTRAYVTSRKDYEKKIMICKRDDCGEEAAEYHYGFCCECCGQLHMLEEEIELYQRKSKTYALRMRLHALIDISQREPTGSDEYDNAEFNRPRTETEEAELVRIEKELDRIHELENPDYKTAEAMRFIRNAAAWMKERTR